MPVRLVSQFRKVLKNLGSRQDLNHVLKRWIMTLFDHFVEFIQLLNVLLQLFDVILTKLDPLFDPLVTDPTLLLVLPNVREFDFIDS